MKRSIGSLFVAAAVTLAAATAAIASGGSVMHAYGGAGNYAGTLGSSAGQSSGTLPFTGLDLTIGLIVAAGLVVLGIVMRRAGRRTQN